jgi:hypothetical protein
VGSHGGVGVGVGSHGVWVWGPMGCEPWDGTVWVVVLHSSGTVHPAQVLVQDHVAVASGKGVGERVVCGWQGGAREGGLVGVVER